MANIAKSKLKKFSKRVTDRARDIVEFNLANPMYRDDARLEIPRQNVKNRGMKLDPNTLLVLHLRHHRPALFWDCTISWKKFPEVLAENISEWCYDLFRLVLLESEIEDGEWSFLPKHLETPMVSIVAPYHPQDVEKDAYHNMVRERQDHEKFDVQRLMGRGAGQIIGEEAMPSGGVIEIATPEQTRRLG